MFQTFLPVIVFIAISIALYLFSNDPDKKKKPINFIVPGLVVGLGVFGFLKYSSSQEPMMQGNYFD